jgi:hypothetical protein
MGLLDNRCNRVVDHANSIAEGLTQGLADIPRGQERALECDVRRGEVLEGLGQIMRLTDMTERDFALLGAREAGITALEFDSYSGKLEWVEAMATGLERGVRDLKRYDTVPEEAYFLITALLRESFQRHTHLTESLRGLVAAAGDDDDQSQEGVESAEDESKSAASPDSTPRTAAPDSDVDTAATPTGAEQDCSDAEDSKDIEAVQGRCRAAKEKLAACSQEPATPTAAPGVEADDPFLNEDQRLLFAIYRDAFNI